MNSVLHVWPFIWKFSCVKYCKREWPLFSLLLFCSDAAVFTTRGNHTIGHKYKKFLFREYEDANFQKEKPHPDYLGFLGPILKGEVGDTIVVHFKNKAGGNFSVHPHGVFYSKDSEGALYVDETKGASKKDDHVPLNGEHTYTWRITKDHAPTGDDDDCLTWIYHSHVLPHKDINTGLIGEIKLENVSVFSMSTCCKKLIDSNMIL